MFGYVLDGRRCVPTIYHDHHRQSIDDMLFHMLLTAQQPHLHICRKLTMLYPYKSDGLGCYGNPAWYDMNGCYATMM